jgi:hypothetical protein
MNDNHIPRIDCLYAFIAKDAQGVEGLPAYQMGKILMPLVGADPARIDSLRKVAREVSHYTGQTLTLCRFSVREELEVIKP